MGRFLNPGNDGFQKIIGAEVYVDKTGIIGFLNKWIYKDARFVCVSRARRFGKTVTARIWNVCRPSWRKRRTLNRRVPDGTHGGV